MEIAFDFGITNTDVAVQDKKELTFYTFSTENWKRPKKEVKFFLCSFIYHILSLDY